MSQKYKKYKIYALIIVAICIMLIGIYFYTVTNTNTSLKNEGDILDSKNFEQELQDILEMQRLQGPMSIMNKDCKEYNLAQSKEYCRNQQDIFTNIIKK